MAFGNSEVAEAQKKKIWASTILYGGQEDTIFNIMGMAGTSNAPMDKVKNIVMMRDELKMQGETTQFELMDRFRAPGIPGDEEASGQARKVVMYSDLIKIGRIRSPINTGGKFNQRLSAFNQQEGYEFILRGWLTDFIERQFHTKAGGVNNELLTTLSGETGLFSQWDFSNAPAPVPDADITAGVGERYLAAGGSPTSWTPSTNANMSVSLIKKIGVRAKNTHSPKFNWIKVGGRKKAVLLIDNNQKFDLEADDLYEGFAKEAQKRNGQHKIYTEAIGEINDIIVVESEYVPYLDISVAGRSFSSATSGPTHGADTHRALLLGSQAIACTKSSENSTLEYEYKDFHNIKGVCLDATIGIQKVQFNGKDFSVFALDTTASDI